MKIKNVYSKTLLLLAFTCTYEGLSSSTLDGQLTPNQNTIIGALKKNAVPAEITQQSRTKFFNQSLAQDIIRGVYNDAQYASLLSMDARPMTSFLDLSNQEQLNLDTEQVIDILGLYHNKYKACELIYDQPIHAILQKLPKTFERHCAINIPGSEPYSLEFIKVSTENIILSHLTEKFSEFQTAPEQFVAHLAETLANEQAKELDNTTNRHVKFIKSQELAHELKSLTVRFFENLFSKIMWHPQEAHSWHSFKLLGEAIDTLDEFSVVTNERHLNDLSWSLVLRFAFFLEIAGATLPAEFYEQAEHDLNEKTVSFLEEKEINDGITTKKDTIINALMQSKIRAVAFQHGMIPDAQVIASHTVVPDGTIKVL